MIIVQISDTHIQSAAPAAAARLDDLVRTVQSINALPVKPDIVLHTGDVAHDATTADYAAARSVLSGLAAPLYATIGNRDRRDTFFTAFAGDGYLRAEFGFAQYAFDAGPLRLVAVDTQDDASALGGFCSARADDLRGLLAAGNGRPTLVFAHHPPVTLPEMKEPSLQYRDHGAAGMLVDCLAEAQSVIGVVTGHVHRARAVPLCGVTLTTVPSIAADLSREKNGEEYVRRPIYQLHRVVGSRLASESILVN